MNIKWRVAQAAEIRWWKNYLRNKSREGYLQQKAAYWRRVLAAAGAQPAPGSRILDAGCGPAGIFIILREQEVDAVDPLLKQYQNHLPHFEPALYPHVKFFAQPLEDFRPAAPYDSIFCLNAINHVARLSPCLEVLAGNLKPGGRLFLSVDAHNSAFLKRLFRWLPGDVLHPHQYSLKEYQVMLEEHGLNIERTLCLKEGRIFNYFLMVAEKKA